MPGTMEGQFFVEFAYITDLLRGKARLNGSAGGVLHKLQQVERSLWECLTTILLLFRLEMSFSV